MADCTIWPNFEFVQDFFLLFDQVSMRKKKKKTLVSIPGQGKIRAFEHSMQVLSEMYNIVKF